MADIIIHDHSDEVLRRIRDDALPVALEAVGQFVEGEAALELENNPRRVDTGRLRGSITHQLGDEGSDTPFVAVGTNVEYALYVHEGTRKMRPNRFLKNAVENNEAQIKRFVENAIKQALR